MKIRKYSVIVFVILLILLGFFIGKNYYVDDDNDYEMEFNNSERVEDKIKISEDGLYVYKAGSQILLGLNGLESTDFTYYDLMYFDIYEYNGDSLTIPSEIDGVKIKKITGLHLNNVKTIKIEEGIEEILDYCFVGANELEKLYLPETVKKIGNKIFGSRNVEIIYY